MTSAVSVFSPRLFTTLTAVVLLAHLAVLRTPVLNTHPVEPSYAFTTRTIEPDLSRLAAPQRSAAPKPPRSKSVPSVPANTDSPKLTQTPDDVNINIKADQPAGSEALTRSGRSEPATVQDDPAAQTDQLALPPQRLREYAALTNADKLPGSVLMKYQVEANKFPYKLNAELLWQQDGKNYEARLTIGLLGQNRVQTSRGQIGSQGLEPIRFSDKYRSEVAAHFVREKGKVTFSANTPDVPLLAGAQDRLSIMIELAAMIASAPKQYPSATTIAIQTIGSRDADTWLFTVGETETLILPNGAQATLKLVRNPRQEFDQKVELWLAPALDYLPARIRITESNGDFIDQKWLSTDAVVEPLK